MKKLFAILQFCVVAGCVLLSGCSKSKNTATPSGNSADSTETFAAADSPAEMRIKWAVGKKYVMRMEFNQGTETTLPNQPQPMKSEVNVAQDFDISTLKQLDNGGWQLGFEFAFENMYVPQGGNK